MRRYAAALLAAIIFTLALAGCSSGYDTEDFIGMTSTEILTALSARRGKMVYTGTASADTPSRKRKRVF